MKRSGFTMIELIFVIVILGILAAVAIPKLAATRDDAKISSMATAIQTAKSEIMAQIVATGQVPTTAADSTPGNNGLDDYSNIVNEKLGGEIVAAGATANGVTFQTENGTGGVFDCVTLDVNLTHLRLADDAGAVATPGSICAGVQALVDMSDIAVRGSRVTY